MNDIGEALAEIGQGSATARAVERTAGEARDGHTHETACLNCGARLLGSHCHQCGQPAHVHRTLGAFFHDLLHGAFHFEGKIWRTLPLLVRHPGRLTREYVDGRRASYVSPIALFLFCVFLMFAMFHLTESDETRQARVDPAELNARILAQQSEIAKLEKNLAAQRSAGNTTDALEERLESAREKLDDLREPSADGARAVDPKDINSGVGTIGKAITKFRANPDLATYKAQTFAYKYSWALIPISVPFMWLLFPFSRRFRLYDHTVFVTYSLCFMTMLATLGMALGALGAGTLAGLLFFIPPFHMYRQLKEAYGLGRKSALTRAILLVAFSGTALFLFFMVVMAQTGA